MIEIGKLDGRLRLALFLAAMVMVCFSLSLFRYVYTGTKVYLFLNWNLFLAAIPWVATSLVAMSDRLRGRGVIALTLLGIWMLFFPNSPYILTDLFHLRLKTQIPIWYDLVLILSFAWTGLMFGFISLFDIEKLLSARFKSHIVGPFVATLLFIGSFGVYIGRYLRWNSLDLLNNPFALLRDIGERFLDPVAHPRTWGVTILMGILLNMIYWSIKILKNRAAHV